MGSNGTGFRTAYLPILLKDVIEKPKLGFYIRHLVLNDLAISFHFVPEDVPYVRRCSDNTRLFIRAAEELGLDIHCRASNQEMDTWSEALERGSEGTIAGLLISRMTHLSTLEWHTGRSDRGIDDPLRLFEICQRIVDPGSAPSLCNLKTVILGKEIDDDGDQAALDVRIVAWFMSLSSVKTIHASGLSFQNLSEDILPPNSSNVSIMLLSYEDDIGATPDRIIACPRKLQSFTDIRQEQYDPDSPSMVDPFHMVCKSLENHARKSLQCLTLRSHDYEFSAPNLQPWSRLSNLRFLGVDLSIFIPRLEDDPVRNLSDQLNLIQILRTRLPSSIEHLRLYELSCRSPDLALEHLMKTLENKVAVFPNLHRLDLCLYRQSGWRPDVEARRQLAHRVSLSCQSKEIDFCLTLHKWGCSMEESGTGIGECKILDAWGMPKAPRYPDEGT